MGCVSGLGFGGAPDEVAGLGLSPGVGASPVGGLDVEGEGVSGFLAGASCFDGVSGLDGVTGFDVVSGLDG